MPNNVALKRGTPEGRRRPSSDYFLGLSDEDPEPFDPDAVDEEPDPFDCDPPDDSLAAAFSGFGPASDFVSLDAGLFEVLARLSARESVR